MKAREYLEKKRNRSPRKRAEKLERKNWHLTQLLGAILYASEDPEKGFTMLERDVLSVDIADITVDKTVDDTTGKALITVRVKPIAAESGKDA